MTTPDRRQRHVARSAVRAMALRTGRSEEEIVSFLGAACVATAFLVTLRAVDLVLEAKPVLTGQVRKAPAVARSRVRSAVGQVL